MLAKKQLGCLIILILLSVGILSGCDTRSDNTKPEVSDQEESSEVVLKIYLGSSQWTDTLERLCADYREKTGVILEWEFPDEKAEVVLRSRFASGDAPDIFGLANGDYDIWYQRCTELSPAAWIEDAYEPAVAGGMHDGRVYGMPIDIVASGIVYNKDLFAAAGIKEVPETYSQLKEACRLLQEAGVQPFGEAWADWGFLAHSLGLPFVYQGAAELSSKLTSGDAEFSDMEYMDNFFDFFDLTLQYGWGSDSVSCHYDDQAEAFSQGKVAMIKQGSWFTSVIQEFDPDMNIGMFAVPLTEDAAQTKLQVSTTNYMSIAGSSPHQKEAKEFLQWFYEHMQEYVVNDMYLVAPYHSLDISETGALNMDMNRYIESGRSYSGFGVEEWPSGFHVDQAEPLKLYAVGAADRETVCDALQVLWNNRVVAFE